MNNIQWRPKVSAFVSFVSGCAQCTLSLTLSASICTLLFIFVFIPSHSPSHTYTLSLSLFLPLPLSFFLSFFFYFSPLPLFTELSVRSLPALLRGNGRIGNSWGQGRERERTEKGRVTDAIHCCSWMFLTAGYARETGLEGNSWHWCLDFWLKTCWVFGFWHSKISLELRNYLVQRAKEIDSCVEREEKRREEKSRAAAVNAALC